MRLLIKPPGTSFPGSPNNIRKNTMAEKTQTFYDVRLRAKVEIPLTECTKTTFAVKNRLRHAVRAVSKASGKDTNVTMFITEQRYNELDIPKS